MTIFSFVLFHTYLVCQLGSLDSLKYTKMNMNLLFHDHFIFHGTPFLLAPVAIVTIFFRILINGFSNTKQNVYGAQCDIISLESIKLTCDYMAAWVIRYMRKYAWNFFMFSIAFVFLYLYVYDSENLLL